MHAAAARHVHGEAGTERRARAIAKKTYIRAKGYAQPIFDAAEEKLKKDPTWRVLPVESGHDVMVDAPDRLVEMLLEAT